MEANRKKPSLLQRAPRGVNTTTSGGPSAEHPDLISEWVCRPSFGVSCAYSISYSAFRLGAACERAGHGAGYAHSCSHNRSEDVAMYLGDLITFSCSFCLHAGSQHPCLPPMTWQWLLWQWGLDGLHALIVFNHGNQDDCYFCYKLIENAVICRASYGS